MTKDRLASFKAAQMDNELDVVVVNDKNRSNGQMKKFYEKVEKIREDIEIMRINVNKVNEIDEQILSEPQTYDKVKQQLEDLMADIRRMTNRVREKLMVMNQNIKQLAKTSTTCADYRIRRTQHSMLTQMVFEVMTDYNKTQIDFRERSKAQIIIQLKLTGLSASNEKLEEMLETGNPFINKEIITKRDTMKQSLTDIEARHESIIKLEKSLQELYDLYNDLAFIVGNESVIIDRIEDQVNKSEYSVNKAKNSLTKSLYLRKS